VEQLLQIPGRKKAYCSPKTIFYILIFLYRYFLVIIFYIHPYVPTYGMYEGEKRKLKNPYSTDCGHRLWTKDVLISYYLHIGTR
jgi:hypothetical protein